jgi:uncharacterized protein YjbI with pentapeptide repeats
MTRDETIALFKESQKGRRPSIVWNAWSQKLLTEKNQLMESRHWETKRFDWEDKASVDFSEFKFGEPVIPANTEINFERFVFPCSANFSSSTFASGVDFQSAIFHGNASFFLTKFLRDAKFGSATFADGANFIGTAFFGRAHFYSATFKGRANFARWDREPGSGFQRGADFELADFEEPVSFSGLRFEGNADFSSIRSRRSFSLGGCTFDAVPSFIAADFHVGPRLDNVAISDHFNDLEFAPIEPIKEAFVDESGQFNEVWYKHHLENSKKISQRSSSEQSKTVRTELSARYRALRRIAKDTDNYRLELDMMAGELIAERAKAITKSGWRKDPTIWFSIGYGLLSDYGRTFVRPLGWWFAVLVVSAIAYLAIADANRAARKGLPCDSSASVYGAALAVAAQKSLLSIGFGKGDGLDGQLDCLFGTKIVRSGTANEMTVTLPDLPLSYTIIVLLQSVASAALLFLFFLGVRNRFRIK